MSNRRSQFALLLAVTALAGATRVAAQNAAQSAASFNPTDPNSPPTSNPTGATVAQGNQLQDIVVTANKRKESLQSVPIAVTAINAQTATAVGITTVASLQTTVPGLQFPKLFSGASPALRGIGTNFGIGGVENVVPIYIDDVYIPSASATTFSFNNIDQIEVLKGPQGTLFGRNAVAGVINITTRNPSSTPKADFSIGYANYNTINGSIYASSPLTDNLRADIAFTGSDQMDGWGKNLFTGKDAFTDKEMSIRSKWVWTPDARTTLTAIVDYSYSKYDEGIAMRPVKGAEFPNPDGTPFTYQGFYNVDENDSSHVVSKQGGISLKAERDLGFATLTDIVAWRKSKAFNYADQDQNPLPVILLQVHDNAKSLSEELRLTSKGHSKLHWLVGFYYFHKNAPTNFTIEGAAVTPLTRLAVNYTQIVDSYAGFGQATYDLPAGFHLTGGLRFTYDDLGAHAVERDEPFAVLTNRQDTTEHAWTYKVNLSKDITRDVSAYAGFSTAFHGGVYNVQSTFAPAVKPETLYAAEAGIKSELFDHKLRLNAAVYHYTYKNMQVTALVRGSSGQVTTDLQNAASAKNTGAEFDFQARPTRALTLYGGASYMHSRFSSFPDATISVPQAGGGNVTVAGSAAGLATPHSPKFSGNFGGDYRIETSKGDFDLAANGTYESSFAWDADNRLKQKPYGLLAASARWTSPDNRWELSVWGKNLTGTKYSIYTTANVIGDEESPAPPRTFGITATAHFF